VFTQPLIRVQLKLTLEQSAKARRGSRGTTLFRKYNQQDTTLCNILYYCQCSTCFRRFLRPSSGAQNFTHSICYMSSLLAATASGSSKQARSHERKKKCSSTLSLTWALDGSGWLRHALASLLPRKRPGDHCIEGWVGPRAGLDGCGKCRPHPDSIPGPSSP
jgi:hypothetical protein